MSQNRCNACHKTRFGVTAGTPKCYYANARSHRYQIDDLGMPGRIGKIDITNTSIFFRERNRAPDFFCLESIFRVTHYFTKMSKAYWVGEKCYS